MTDLQLGSLVIGGAIVVLVYAYNWWQERNYRKQAQKAFSRHHQSDVLLETPKNMVRSGEARRLEPSIAQEKEPPFQPSFTAENTEIESFDDEPKLEDLGDLDDYIDPEAALAVLKQKHAEQKAAQQPQIAKVAAQRIADVEEDQDESVITSSLLDPALDFIAEVHAGQPVPAENVPVFPGAKRIMTLGMNDDDQWEVVQSNKHSQYMELQIGLQLADRQGALTQEQMNAFCMGVQQFADEFDAVVTFPQRASKMNSARELDEFCASVDVLIGLNVIAGDKPFPMEKVRVLAEGAGLVRGVDHNYHYNSNSGKTLFTLSNQDETPFGTTSEGLTLLFDVPRVAGGLAVFDYLADFAQNLSSSLGGELVDDNGKPLTEASLNNIRKQLSGLYAAMDDRGIAAGSVAALRLFA